jgi:hypothetical protein
VELSYGWEYWSGAGDQPSGVRPDFDPTIAGQAAGGGGGTDLTKVRVGLPDAHSSGFCEFGQRTPLSMRATDKPAYFSIVRRTPEPARSRSGPTQ